MADHDLLSSNISNTIKALRFTITDVGSRWEETVVTHTIKHQGKRERIRNKIGIKLSERLAAAKGLGLYGHTEDTGPFKGGKKLGHRQGEKP